MKFRTLIQLLPMLLLVGCSGWLASNGDASLNATSTPAVTGTATVQPAAQSATPESLATPTPTAEAGGSGSADVTLRLWLPPQFDPGSGSEAGELLQARLDEFSRTHPAVRLEVRIKAVDGPGGLSDALSAASAAAPQALPDLVALPRPALEAAALKGLLRPFDNLTHLFTSPGWYNFARQLAYVQNSTFGIPFACDALLMVYRPALVGATPPADWASAQALGLALAFPASDPQALFTLALYQASGGAIQDEQGLPMLSETHLLQVLNFYDEAGRVGLMPNWLTLYETDLQAWDAYTTDQTPMAITWVSRYLAERPANSSAAAFPTPNGEPFTLATGWVWAQPTNTGGQALDIDAGAAASLRQILSIELVEFLTEENFLAQWTAAAGYLPPHASSLAAWPDETLRHVLDQLALAARIQPTADVLTSLSLPLQQAAIDVLKQQVDPQAAARAAVERLTPDKP